MGAILAIDQGTSGTKSLVVGDGGDVLSIVEKEIHPDYLADGGVEQDPEELWRSVLETSHEAVTRAGSSVDAVTLTNQGESVLAWDPMTGEPLSNIIVWQDSRAQSVCSRIKKERCGIEAEILAATGLVLDPYFTAPKMMWLRENVTRKGIVTTTDTWMLARLTGELVTDAATASRSLLVRLGETEWDDDLLSLFGLGDETMPRIVANDVVVGFTTEYGSEVPVAGIIVDQQGALIAESCLAPGDAKCTFGTGAFLLTNTGQSIKTPSSGLSACVAWRTGSDFTYCYDGQVYTAASAVRWIQELGLIDSPAQMDHVAMEGDEMFVPGLAGLAAPWWDSKPSGAFTNLSLSTARGSLVGAVLEGIAANTAVLTELVKKESGIGLSTLKVDGGLTRSKFLMQAVANLNQVPVEVYASPHATPLGAVALCRKALTHQPLAECVLPWHPIATFEPIWTHAKAADYKEKWNMNVSAIVKEIN